jgi:hypothetical protein
VRLRIRGTGTGQSRTGRLEDNLLDPSDHVASESVVLALGGVAKMSQLQLLSPFLSIYAAHLILGEVVDATVIVGAVLITAIVVAGRLSLRRP